MVVAAAAQQEIHIMARITTMDQCKNFYLYKDKEKWDDVVEEVAKIQQPVNNE